MSETDQPHQAPQVEQPKEELAFTKAGVIKYELELQPNQFSYRSQISNDNNLCATMMTLQFIQFLIQEKSKPVLKKEDKPSPKEIQDLKTTERTLQRYSEQIASALYNLQLEEVNKPKLKIVTNEEFLNDKLKK